MDQHSPFDPQSLTLLISKLREATLESLKSHSGVQTIQLIECEDGPLIPGHWMTLILASGRELRVTLKFYYMSQDVHHLAKATYADKRLTLTQTTDFLKEFCNLTIGRLKRFIEGNNLAMGVSLPVTTRGYDELFATAASPHTAIENWLLTDSGQDATAHERRMKLHCRAVVEFYGPVKLIDQNSPVEDKSGIVDFLGDL